MHIEVLVEDSSGARLMAHLLPKFLGVQGESHTWRVHNYKGIGRIPKNMTIKSDPVKKTLLENLRKALGGYGRTPGYDAVFVLVDTDARHVDQFKKELETLVQKCQHPPRTAFGLATEEVEAWYLGDRPALTKAYPKADAKILKRYVQDSVCGTWELLAEALVKGGAAAIKTEGWRRAGDLKHEWAEKIGPLMDINKNSSPSFCIARDNLTGLTT
jgi:Domain of unknown function (DUF4276)